MKILQVIPSLCAGGAEGFVTNLGVALAGLNAEVRFFTLAGVRRERGQVLLGRLRNAGIEVEGLEDRKPASLANLMRLRQSIRLWGPDIVQANLYSCEVACAVAKMSILDRGPRYVRRLAGTDICGYRSVAVVRHLDRVYKELTIACSSAVADAYQSFMGAHQKSRLEVITNGGLLREVNPSAEEKRGARISLGLPDDAFVVAHIGRMLGKDAGSGLESEPKAQDVLLHAFAKAFEARPDALLLLVGDGRLRPEAEALARSLGLENCVRFLGEQPEPWPALMAADLFCFPSRHEGLPNALVEAASCALPVLTTDIPEIASLSPGDAWVHCAVDDVVGLARGLRDIRSGLDWYTQRAREAAQGFRDGFSMRVCAERYLKAYASVMRQDSFNA